MTRRLALEAIRHAFRVTVRATNGYVFPASHRAGSTAGALPMGARLRLKSNKNLASFTPELQRVFRAMQRYGLIVADNGSDMFIGGAYDSRWNNDILNPAFRALTANDFDVSIPLSAIHNAQSVPVIAGSNRADAVWPHVGTEVQPTAEFRALRNRDRHCKRRTANRNRRTLSQQRFAVHQVVRTTIGLSTTWRA